jgi:mRNA interferase YafQ
MRSPVSGAQFRRDVKAAQKRGKDIAKLREVILLLTEPRPLPPRYRDHPLGGDWKHYRDCHIEPDWLLIYKIDGDDLHLVRTGTHPICSEILRLRHLCK